MKRVILATILVAFAAGAQAAPAPQEKPHAPKTDREIIETAVDAVLDVMCPVCG